MTSKIYSDMYAELVADVTPSTGTIKLSVITTKTQLRIASLSIPKAAIPELIQYLQKDCFK